MLTFFIVPYLVNLLEFTRKMVAFIFLPSCKDWHFQIQIDLGILHWYVTVIWAGRNRKGNNFPRKRISNVISHTWNWLFHLACSQSHLCCNKYQNFLFFLLYPCYIARISFFFEADIPLYVSIPPFVHLLMGIWIASTF